MERHGFKWMHRLFQDPGRLPWYYFAGNTLIICYVVGHRLRWRSSALAARLRGACERSFAVSPCAMEELGAALLDEKTRALRAIGGGGLKVEANDWHDVSDANDLLEL